MSIVRIIKRALCFSFPLSFLSLPAIAQDAPITADGTTGTQINTNDGSNFDIGGGDRAGGNIDINADSVFLTNNSFISSGTFGTGEIGDININAKKEVSLNDSSIANFVGDTGQGESGNINIETGSLSLTNNSLLATATLGQGNSGSIAINAIDNVVLDNSIIDSFTGSTGVGNSGEIAIAAKNLSIANGGRVSTATLGKGNSGNISIQARGSISIDGEGSSGFRSGIETSTEETGEGNSGDINISTGSLTLTDDAAINASTFGIGNAGNIFINAKDAVKLSNAYIFSTVGTDRTVEELMNFLYSQKLN
jgi:large exoprotein involved in heme utilization and adhesion